MRKIFVSVICAAMVADAGAQANVADETPVTAPHAMVVSVQHYATDAGVEILREGGNAVDAAVAVGFALAVVYPVAGNIGGGGFMLIRPANAKVGGGKLHFLDYREAAPAAASADMYLDAKGDVIPKMSTIGQKASGVPGSVAGLSYAEAHFGKLGLKKVMAPAIKLASDGFTVDAALASNMHSERLGMFAASKRIFQHDGNFYNEGDTFKQPELAKTLERISEKPDDFYRGAMAQEITAFEKANGGLITASDLAAYQCKERAPLVGQYRGLEVVSAPPPSSGGVVLLEILNILGGYDLTKFGGDRSPAQVHYISEAFRRAFMDRADFLGDPDFNPAMPIQQMMNPDYAAAWRKTIDATKPSPSATLVRPAGFMPEPPKAKLDHESKETTQYSVVDADGNAVSVTTTLNFYFGSGVTVDGLGFMLNDEMDDFASKMGVPNGFGLIQGPANAIAPGKRPLSAMTPTIVSEMPKGSKPGALRYVLGSPGGPTIITTVANDLISMLDNGLNVQAAADAPRFHHQWMPDTLQFEKKFPVDVVDALKKDGYNVKRLGEFDEKTPGQWGDSEMIARDPKTGMLMGADDKRYKFGKAAGY
jgi:gamma-glutamyltranspeptidase/glutathione hydrolase